MTFFCCLVCSTVILLTIAFELDILMTDKLQSVGGLKFYKTAASDF